MAGLTHSATDLRSPLEAVVGADHVRDDAGALLTFSTDATPLQRGAPDIVVFPGSAEEVAAVLRIADERRVPVVPRGSGTNLSAGTVPHRGGIVLVLTRMDRIREISPDDLVAVCEPGVRTIELAQAAAEQKLLFPPDPGSHTTATIGGNVAECSGGLRALKYGVTRDYVLGVEAVLATGEIIRSGGRLVKDVAGYDLRRLLCGSEGTLAVMTELTLRLMPAPEESGTGMAYFTDLADAARAVSRVLSSGVLPVTLEFLDRVCIDAVEGYSQIGLDRTAGALLIFGQDGDPGTIERDMRRMADACEAEGATDVRIAATAEEAADLLQARRAVLPALSRLEPLTILEDATVPRSRIAEMVARIQEIAERHGLLIGTFGHAGDGNLHPTVVLDAADEDAIHRAHEAFDEIFAHAIE
ncbi:MAG: glycolate oxidase, partial [Solirubrobacteraceae bacterium]|nr:glycolate oxidase [Solirubrobacteraceae bacterium]